MRILIDQTSKNPGILDTSEIWRPEKEEKKKEAFRDFSTDTFIGQRIKKTYYDMHTNQTVEFVRAKHEKWLKFNHFQATIMEALEMLNELVDESDPDTDLPNIVHAFQTAERIREDHPDKEWFQLCGLIHDLGKVMAFYGEPQWCVVGDTFPVGCKPGQTVVFGDDSFKDNVDLKDPRYNTELGMYAPGCGMENVLMSWGHDEYMYHVILNHMKKAGTNIPEGGLWSIRFHSCYPWHTGKDYKFLENEKDQEILKWVEEFNQYDLYTKSAEVPDIDKLKPYYQSLIDKYLPGVIDF